MIPSPRYTTDFEQRLVSRSLSRAVNGNPRLALRREGGAGRAPVETLIAAQFFQCHGARIDHFLPLLLSLEGDNGCRAALGLQPAYLGPLFLEQYLSHPAEQVTAQVLRQPVYRRDIMEVGNLVATGGNDAALLYLLLVAVLARAGFPWVLFTATPAVERGIRRLGFAIAPICPADPSRLEGGAGRWGSYYDNTPRVMFGLVVDTLAGCRQRPLFASLLERFRQPINGAANQLAPLY